MSAAKTYALPGENAASNPGNPAADGAGAPRAAEVAPEPAAAPAATELPTLGMLRFLLPLAAPVLLEVLNAELMRRVQSAVSAAIDDAIKQRGDKASLARLTAAYRDGLKVLNSIQVPPGSPLRERIDHGRMVCRTIVKVADEMAVAGLPAADAS